MTIVEFIITVSFGFILGKIGSSNNKPSIFKKFYDYIASPVDNRLELNWSLRQIFNIFSNRISERWYEARCHLYQGVFRSLLCAFGIVQILRYEFYTDEDCRVSYNVVYYYFLSDKQVLNKALSVPFAKDSELDKKQKEYGIFQIFIAGQNVVSNNW